MTVVSKAHQKVALMAASTVDLSVVYSGATWESKAETTVEMMAALTVDATAAQLAVELVGSSVYL